MAVEYFLGGKNDVVYVDELEFVVHKCFQRESSSICYTHLPVIHKSN